MPPPRHHIYGMGAEFPSKEAGQAIQTRGDRAMGANVSRGHGRG